MLYLFNMIPFRYHIPIRNKNDSRKYQLVDNSLLSGNNNVNFKSDEYIFMNYYLNHIWPSIVDGILLDRLQK